MIKRSESDTILDTQLFIANQKLLSIKDFEKFINCDMILSPMFNFCN